MVETGERLGAAPAASLLLSVFSFFLNVWLFQLIEKNMRLLFILFAGTHENKNKIVLGWEGRCRQQKKNWRCLVVDCYHSTGLSVVLVEEGVQVGVR